MGRQHRYLPLAESFLVLIILAAYSWPASTFTHLRTTEKAPLEDREQHDGVRGLKNCLPRLLRAPTDVPCRKGAFH